MRDQSSATENRTIATAFVAGFLCVLLAGTAAAAQPIADAAARGDIEAVIAHIADGEDVDQAQPDGTTGLIWAAYQGDVEVLTALLAAGADTEATNNFGVKALIQASHHGDAPIIAALIDGGASLDVTSETGVTPLMAAARAGSAESVRLLLDNGADPNAVESLQHQTALMWATAEKHLDVVGLLLEAGADPNMQARETTLEKRSPRTDFPSGGFTALMWAAREADLPMTQLLLDGGADINITNADGASPLMIAIVNDRFDYAQTLLGLGADPNDGSLYQAVLMRDATTDWFAKDGTQMRADHPNELDALALTRVLLEAGADPNKPFVGQLHSTSMCCDTKENGTPFFRAAVAGDVDAMALLIEHGADIEWRPTAQEGEAVGGLFGNQTIGKTALMVAMNGGRGVGMSGGPGDVRDGAPAPFREVANREPVDAMRVLLEAGADPDAVTRDKGESALHMAARDGLIEIVALLAEFGATLDMENADGETALDIVEAQEPRAEGDSVGALVDRRARAQPAEIAARLRELMGGAAPAQASLQETR